MIYIDIDIDWINHIDHLLGLNSYQRTLANVEAVILINIVYKFIFIFVFTVHSSYTIQIGAKVEDQLSVIFKQKTQG